MNTSHIVMTSYGRCQGTAKVLLFHIKEFGGDLKQVYIPHFAGGGKDEGGAARAAVGKDHK